MNLEVKIEISSIVKKVKRLPNGDTHSFIVSVRGLNGNQIEHFVKQVVFYLPSNSNHVRRKPPYIISGSAHASFRLPIDIFLHTSEMRNKFRYSYYVYLPDKPVEDSVNVKTLTFLNTPQDFSERLLLGGAEAVDLQTNSTTVATRVKCKSEPVEIIENQDVNSEDVTHTWFSDTSVQNQEQNDGMVIQGIYSFDELLKENKILKKENENLCNEFSNQEGVISTYVEKLPVLQNKFSAVIAEFNQLKQKAEANEAEISNLKSSIQRLMSEAPKHKNKVNEVKRVMKQPEISTVSSPFISESFPCMSSKSLKNEPDTNNFHKVFSKEKGRMLTNQSTVPPTSLEFTTSNTASKIMQDTWKNQLGSNCDTSENIAASGYVSECDTARTIQRTSAPETLLMPSHSKNITKNSQSLFVQNKPSSCSNNLNGTVRSDASPRHLVGSICSSHNMSRNLFDSHTKSERKSSTKRKNTEFTNLNHKKGNLISSNCESVSFEKRYLLKDSTNDLFKKAIQEYGNDKLQPNLNKQKRDPVESSSNHPSDNMSLRNSSMSRKNVQSLPIENTSTFRELPSRIKNTSTFDEFQLTEQAQVPSSEIRHGEPSDFNPKIKEPLIPNLKKGNTFEKGVQQCINTDPKIPSSPREDLNLQGSDPVISDFQNSGPDSFQIICENISESTTRKCIKRETQDSPEITDAGHADLNLEKTNVVTQDIRKLSIQCDSLGRQTNEDIFEEMVLQECVRNEPSSSKTIKEMSDLNPGEMEVAPPDTITTLDYFPKDHKNSKDCVPNVSETNLPQNVIEETTDNLFEESIQECVKGELQINSNKHKKDPVASNSNHLEIPTWKIIDDRKKLHKTKSLSSVPQKIVCSIPLNTLLNTTNSSKHPRIDEKVDVHAKCFADATTVENKVSSAIPVQIKNTIPENDNTLNSLHQNLFFSAETSENQPISSFITAGAKFKKRAKSKKFLKSKKGPKFRTNFKHILKGIDDRLISEAKLNYYVHLLTQFLVEPTGPPDIQNLIFCVVHHLLHTTKNYLQAFIEDRANCKFVPSSESCIVLTLFEIEKTYKIYSELKLIKNVLNTIQELVIAAKNFNINGLASLCRVYTEICKKKSDLIKPLLFCVNILKMRFPCSAYLIASIAGVWKEPFMLPNDQSEEAMMLLGTISLGAGKKPKKMPLSIWLCLKELISDYLSFPSLPDGKKAINFLQNKIISNCLQNSHEKSWMVTSSLVILADYQYWNWTKKHLIHEYILPNLSRFSEEEPNEKAFALFCDLYVDVYNRSRSMPYDVLLKYFRKGSNNGSSFLQEWSAISLLKYIIWNKRPIESCLSKWIESNQEKSSVQMFREFYQRRHMHYCKGMIKKKNDIVIT